MRVKGFSMPLKMLNFLWQHEVRIKLRYRNEYTVIVTCGKKLFFMSIVPEYEERLTRNLNTLIQ